MTASVRGNSIVDNRCSNCIRRMTTNGRSFVNAYLSMSISRNGTFDLGGAFFVHICKDGLRVLPCAASDRPVVDSWVKPPRVTTVLQW